MMYCSRIDTAERPAFAVVGAARSNPRAHRDGCGLTGAEGNTVLESDRSWARLQKPRAALTMIVRATILRFRRSTVN